MSLTREWVEGAADFMNRGPSTEEAVAVTTVTATPAAAPVVDEPDGGLTEEERDLVYALRAEGVAWHLIAGTLGRTVYECRRACDPDWVRRRREATRKAWSRASRCVACGAPVSYHGHQYVGRKCRPCSKRKWTRAAIIAAVHDFVATHGRPPTKRDWEKASAGRYPHAKSVYGCTSSPFASWNEALAAAGHETQAPVARG